MAKKNLPVSFDYVNQCTETINEFEAVRKDSFIKFVMLTLDVTETVADKVIDEMKDMHYIDEVAYANTKIVKTDSMHKAVYRKLDAFDAYLKLLEEALEDEGKQTVIPLKASFPRDFTFYDTRGYLYSVFIYDDNLRQKLGVFDRKKPEHLKAATMIVFTVGTNLKKVDIPTITGPYRYALVRKSEGIYACEISEIQGEEL